MHVHDMEQLHAHDCDFTATLLPRVARSYTSGDAGQRGLSLSEVHACARHGASGGSRNLDRGVQQVGWHIHSAPLKAVRRAAKWRSVHAECGKKNLRVLFSDQEALS